MQHSPSPEERGPERRSEKSPSWRGTQGGALYTFYTFTLLHYFSFLCLSLNSLSSTNDIAVLITTMILSKSKFSIVGLVIVWIISAAITNSKLKSKYDASSCLTWWKSLNDFFVLKRVDSAPKYRINVFKNHHTITTTAIILTANTIYSPTWYKRLVIPITYLDKQCPSIPTYATKCKYTPLYCLTSMISLVVPSSSSITPRSPVCPPLSA